MDEPKGSLSRSAKIKGIVIILSVLVPIVFIFIQQLGTKTPTPADSSISNRMSEEKNVQAKSNLPRLVDLGAKKCIPCKMMAPVLEELMKEYQGKLDVVFIDVWENPDAGKEYGIRLIPTQIFYDVAGKELFRHEGFFAKADILSKFRELGVMLE